jgi:hypothetical protein
MVSKDGKQAQGTQSTWNSTKTDGIELDTANRKATCGQLKHSIKERSVRPRQHLPPSSLDDQQRTGAVHITLTLHESYTQLPVGTSKERPPGDSQRAPRRDMTQGASAGAVTTAYNFTGHACLNRSLNRIISMRDLGLQHQLLLHCVFNSNRIARCFLHTAALCQRDAQ